MTEHMLDIGSERRIGVDVLAKLARADAELHGKAEDVYKLLTGMSDEMRPENMVAVAIHDNLRPRGRLDVGTRRKPVAHVVDVDVDSQAFGFRGGLGQTDSGKGRNRIDRGCDACVVGNMLRSMDNIAADEIALISRDRRELRRGRNDIAADIDRRIAG
jgi:hypothetical protein